MVGETGMDVVGETGTEEATRARGDVGDVGADDDDTDPRGEYDDPLGEYDTADNEAEPEEHGDSGSSSSTTEKGMTPGNGSGGRSFAVIS